VSDLMDRVFDRFNPDTYQPLMANEHAYTVRTVFNSTAMELAAGAVRSCLLHERHNGALDAYEDDPYTLFQTIARDDVTKGYTRSFLLEDDDGDLFLGIDTIEVPLKDGTQVPKEKHKAFAENQDIVKAGALAAVQTGLDLGVKYVAARDTRIRYGAKDGYSGVKQSMRYEKPGETVQSYVVADDGLVHPGVRNLDTLPGDAPYVQADVDDVEVRGFDTLEPHETTAYLLMENPMYGMDPA